MQQRVWVLGDAVIDLLPDGHGRLLQCPGGAPANVAVGIARLNGNSAFIGRVGDDPFGRYLHHTLQKEQVNTDYMQFDKQRRTSTVVVDLDAEGERSFTFMVRPSADLFLEQADLPDFNQGEWLHCCSIALSAEPSFSTTLSAMQRITSVGGFVSFDPNIRRDLWKDDNQLLTSLEQALMLADVIKLSEEELQFIADEVDSVAGLKRLGAKYQPLLIQLTRGKDGVTAWYQQQIYHYPAKSVVTVDTTGAGDAFVAGLLSGLVNEGIPEQLEELAQIIAKAQVCGALATTAKGAMTALPYQRDLAKQF
jgi:fructokinase